MSNISETPTPQNVGRRSPDFYAAYANQIRFETSSWDLKIIFGQLDQSAGSPDVEWQSAVTIPWAQVKLGIFSLQAQVAAYEHLFGKIQTPWDVIPPGPTKPSDEELARNPASKGLYEKVLKLYEDFKATL
jgi:hypothetical protein